MGIGLGPDSRNFTPFPGAARNNAKAVAAWLEYNAPCVVGDIPFEWTHALVQHLKRNLVSDQVISAALLDLAHRGSRFAGMVPYQPRPMTPQTSMGPAPSAGDRRRGLQLQAEHLEFAFQKAELNEDAQGMQKAAEQYLELLGQILSPTSKPMPGRGSFARHREQLQEAAELLRSNAPALTALVRGRGFEVPSVDQLFQRVRANRARRQQRRR